MSSNHHHHHHHHMNSSSNKMKSYMMSPKQMPARTAAAADGFQRNGRAWFVATELQSDLVVEVGDISFNLHKFPLLSRSGRLNRLVFESRDTQKDHIRLPDMPGGPEAFVMASKFCYGVSVDLTPANIAALRCASEYLEMTEDLGEGNLISKTETFLSFVVLASWKDSIAVLRSLGRPPRDPTLAAWAEKLHIVRRCSESVAWKACTDPRGLAWAYTTRARAEPKHGEDLSSSCHTSGSTFTTNTASTNPHDDDDDGDDDDVDDGDDHANVDQTSEANHKNQQKKQKMKDVYRNHGIMMVSNGHQVPQDWWVEDLLELAPPYFVKVMSAIKSKGMKPDIVGVAVVRYGSKWVPGLNDPDHDNDEGGEEEDHDTQCMDHEVTLTLDDNICFNMEPNGNAHHDHYSINGSLSKNEASDSVKKDHPYRIQSSGNLQGLKHRATVEGLVGLLPNEKDLCSYKVPCGFLLRLVRIGNMLGVSEECRQEVERRVGLQLDEANVGDLLIPSLLLTNGGLPKLGEVKLGGHLGSLEEEKEGDRYLHHIMFDVDLVHRLVMIFLSHLTHDGMESGRDAMPEPCTRDDMPGYPPRSTFEFPSDHVTTTTRRTTTTTTINMSEDKHSQDRREGNSKYSKLNRVGKLLDDYLAEVARDTLLPISKFRALAEMLPDTARSCHDGLYRAIDTYLKAHPTTGDTERRQLSGVMDCQKLSLKACMHAVQNERLPLRLVVQILFYEHVKLYNATMVTRHDHMDGNNVHTRSLSCTKNMDDTVIYDPRNVNTTHNAYYHNGDALSTELHLLKVDVESIKAKYVELSADYMALQRLLFQSSTLSNIHKSDDIVTNQGVVVSHTSPSVSRRQLNMPRPMSSNGGRRMSGISNGLRKLGHLFTSRISIDSDSANNNFNHESCTSNPRFGRRRRNSMS